MPFKGGGDNKAQESQASPVRTMSSQGQWATVTVWLPPTFCPVSLPVSQGKSGWEIQNMAHINDFMCN